MLELFSIISLWFLVDPRGVQHRIQGKAIAEGEGKHTETRGKFFFINSLVVALVVQQNFIFLFQLVDLVSDLASDLGESNHSRRKRERRNIMRMFEVSFFH